MMRFTVFIFKVLGILASFIAGTFLFLVISEVLSIWIKLVLDMPVYTTGVYISFAGGALFSAYVFSILFGRKKWWKVCVPLFVFLLAAAVFFMVIIRAGPVYEYTGSSREEIIETIKDEKNPPTFLLSINSEARKVHALTLDRPKKTFYLDRKPGEPLSFAAGAPELTDRKMRLEVAALVSANVTHPIFKTPPLDPDKWNEYTIPPEKLNPSMQNFRIRMLAESGGKEAQPLAFVTELEALHDFKAPNVVVVMVDTLRADHVDAKTAPFLTSFMKKSVVMEETMAPSSWTVPSTASVLTGLYPHQHGYISNAHMEFKKVKLISEHFQSKGYRTGGISGNRLIDERYGFARGFDRFISLGRIQYNYLNSGGILTIHAKDWIDRDQQRPFFLYLHYMDPHFPYLAPPPDTFMGLEGISKKVKSLYAFFQYDNRDFTNKWLIDHPEAVPLVISRYRGEIRYWDRQLEDLVSYIKKQGLLSNTIIVVVSDHGEAFGEHGNYRHGSSLFEEEVHVPLVIFDGRRPVAARIRTPVSSIETAKIITGMAGMEPPQAWHGRTIEKLLEKNPEQKNLAAVLSYRHFHPMEGETESVKVSLAARRGDKKIIIKYDDRTGTKEKMLFNLAEDPHEKQNLWTYPESEELPLYKWMTGYLPPPDSMTYKPEEKNKQLEKDLKALGYVQ